MLQTEAIKAFLVAKTHKDLADLYNLEMEVQVNAAQDNGVRTQGEYQGRTWHGWQDPVDPGKTWKSFRIPYRAKTDPEYNPKEQTWPLGLHAEGVGLTGWNWARRCSLWVAYDFDSIANHKQGLSADELEALKTTAMQIPWVTVRKSTSGRGYHLYVFLPSISTENHTEHAALGRAILGMLSAKTGFDFQSKVDACGGNMWVWHRKMTGTDGLKLIKAGSTLTDIPVNWKDHLEVVKGNRRKNLPRYIEGGDVDLFEELCGTRPRIKLEEAHIRVQQKLDEVGAQWWWDQDHWMMVCHTADLKRVHSELNLRGIFETVAVGKERGADHNCFCFPIRRGAWVVRRYTAGIQEHASWEQDKNGYTRCFLNQEPDLQTAARSSDGIELEKGGFVFQEAEVAVKVADQLGAAIKLPNWAMNREAVVRHHKKDGRLIMQVKHEAKDNGGDMPGWQMEKGYWTRIFNIKVQAPSESEVGNYDDLVRHLITDSGEDYNWSINSGQGWQTEPINHVKLALKSMNFGDREINNVLGNCVLRSWTVVNIPFEDEFPGDRKWNRNAAQLRFKPKLEEPYEYSTWMKVLNHCGSGLDEAVLANEWCQIHGVKTGGDYLKVWVASIFQQPKEPLPYLFFYSEEEATGKSTFHEALSLLVNQGYIEASQAITSDGGFNGELQNAVICVIDEFDLSKHKDARNRIKNWVTAREISVHIKGQTPYHIVNTTHWIQTANSHLFCPVFPGDSRITMVCVPPFSKDELVPKFRLFQLLEKEAPDFLGAIMSVEIPAPDDRLAIPIIETQEKKRTAIGNMTQLQAFIEEKCFKIPGALTKFSDFYDSFIGWLDAEEVGFWSKIRVGRELPQGYPKGRNMQDQAQFYVGNVSLRPGAEGGVPWRVVNNTLERTK